MRNGKAIAVVLQARKLHHVLARAGRMYRRTIQMDITISCWYSDQEMRNYSSGFFLTLMLLLTFLAEPWPCPVSIPLLPFMCCTVQKTQIPDLADCAHSKRYDGACSRITKCMFWREIVRRDPTVTHIYTILPSNNIHHWTPGENAWERGKIKFSFLMRMHPLLGYGHLIKKIMLALPRLTGMELGWGNAHG